jgi:hypothetical protein
MDCPEVGDARQELAALTVTLCTRIGITLGLTNEVHDITIGFDDCPIWAIAAYRSFNFKPTWELGEVTDFTMLINVAGEVTFDL